MSAPSILLSIIPPGGTEPVRPDDARGWDRVLSLSVAEKLKTAPKATISIRNDDNRFPDDPMFDIGAVLVLQWGYYPRLMTPAREYIVQKWTPGVPVFKVEAHGKAVLMHKVKKVKTWENMTPVEVVRALARQNGYGDAVQDVEDFDTEVRPTITQRGYTDADMLRRIAKHHSVGGIELIWYVDGNGFHFHRKRIGAKPTVTKTYVRPPGEGDFKKFPTFEASPVAKPGKVAVAGIDPNTQKPITATASDDTTAGRPGLAPVKMVLDKATGEKTFQTAAATETTKPTGATSQNQATKSAGATFARANSNPVKYSGELFGDPLVTIGIVIDTQGVGRRLSGNYHVTECVHDVKPGDFSQKIKTERDGLSAGGTGPVAGTKAKVNDKPGPVDKPEEKLEPEMKIDGATGEKTIKWKPGGGKS